MTDGMVKLADDAIASMEAAVGVMPNPSNLLTMGLLPADWLVYVPVGVPFTAARTPMIESCLDDDRREFFGEGDASGLTDGPVKRQGDQEVRASFAASPDESHTWPEEAAHEFDFVESLARPRP